jgi:hypothetical protein
MSNIKPIFYFGTIILSLIFVTTSSTTSNYFYDPKPQTLPFFEWYYLIYQPQHAYAQEEDKEEEEKEEEEKEDEKDKDSKDEDDGKDDEKDKDDEEQKDKDESEGAAVPTTAAEEELNNTTSPEQVQEIVQNELDGLMFMNNSATEEAPTQEQQPIMNLTGDHILNPIPIETTTSQPTIAEQEEQQQFNATCNCTIITSSKQHPTTTATTTTTTTPPPPLQEEQPEQQIPITNTNIKSSKSFGQIVNPDYTGFYTVSNLLDNTVNDISFWSQAGKSSFYVELDSIMDNYQVCSAELNVYNPKGTPYLLDIGVSKNYTGVIDQTTEKIQFDKCVKNMDELLMIFDLPDKSFISIAEMKLFGKKIGTDTPPSPTPNPDPTPTPPPQPGPYHNATKINIQNSTAEIDIKNSTVTFKFDPHSAQATNYNVITLPNTEVVN